MVAWCRITILLTVIACVHCNLSSLLSANAFTPSNWIRKAKYTVHHPLCHATSDIDCNNEEEKNKLIYTTAVIKVAYDGTYFKGWTAGNSDPNNTQDKCVIAPQKQKSQQQSSKKRQSRRSRSLQRKGGSYGYKSGRIRTVDDTIRSTLAKVYGDVDTKQIKIDACSRTDKGVHSESLIAQFYCIKDINSATHYRRPTSCSDTSNFLPIPFDSSLSKLVFVMNRMLPPDVRIVAASPLPYVSSSTPKRGSVASSSFHPTLHTMGKTYKYQFAIGPVHDPIRHQYLWHLDGSSSRAVGMNGNKFCLERALAAAQLFVDSNDKNMDKDTAKARDYGAFRAAFRGTDRGRIQSTICKLWKCDILQERNDLLPSWEVDMPKKSDDEDDIERYSRYGSRLGKSAIDSNDSASPQTFTVIIVGNRFLYKMVRNIVGTIVAVGCGYLELDDVRIALDTGKWETERRICAPSRGLTLVDVQYPPDIIFDWRTG